MSMDQQMRPRIGGETAQPKMEQGVRKCTDCRFCLMEDYGYSNWTVEGTQVYCLKRLHPKKEGFDHWYGNEKELLFAAECGGFEAGEPITVDVDREIVGENDPWWMAYIEDDERRDLMAEFNREAKL